MAVGTGTLLLATLMAVGVHDVGNRLTYLDEFCDPYYVGLDAPKLITPQWVGEEGVEAVIVLAIDDMRDPAPYEKFLRPILERLKQIDGRAPVSIMTVRIDPADPHLQTWLREGVSIETHTFDHPCPCLFGGSLEKAKATFDQNVDLIAGIPNHRPTAFRMPCCDSMNSPSPRFFTEVFNKTTPTGSFLQIDSSVFVLFTPDDSALPRELVYEPDGRLRFFKYVPQDRDFANMIHDYPYPYVIGRLCWELPSPVPDDWQGFHFHSDVAHHPTTVADMKAAIDATIVKQGVFTLTFHPGRWIRNDQVIDMIDHAVKSRGRRVKVLNFREVAERLTRNLLGGQTLRAANGQDNGVRLLDVNNDGYMDVVIGNEHVRQTRVWSPEARRWSVTDFPVSIVRLDQHGNRHDAGVRFGVLQERGNASFLVRNEDTAGLWHFDGKKWSPDPSGLAGLAGRDVLGTVSTSLNGLDQGVRLRDLDRDGRCELIVGNPSQRAVFGWSGEHHRWAPKAYSLPDATRIVDEKGSDAGLRFVDINDDGHTDVIFSNAEQFSAHLFAPPDQGWSRQVRSGKQGDDNSIPPIVRADGTNNGAWFNFAHMWVQNEQTGKQLPNHVDRRSFRGDLLASEQRLPVKPP